VTEAELVGTADFDISDLWRLDVARAVVQALDCSQIAALADLYAEVRTKNLEIAESKPLPAETVGDLWRKLGTDHRQSLKLAERDLRPANIKVKVRTLAQPLVEGKANGPSPKYTIQFRLTRVPHTIASAEACTDKRIWKVKVLAHRLGIWARFRKAVVCKHYPGTHSRPLPPRVTSRVACCLQESVQTRRLYARTKLRPTASRESTHSLTVESPAVEDCRAV
jgi:hypothetical protein